MSIYFVVNVPNHRGNSQSVLKQNNNTIGQGSPTFFLRQAKFDIRIGVAGQRF